MFRHSRFPNAAKALLAFLIIHANRVVSAERIVDELYGDEPPESGAKAVAFHVSRLRDALEPGRPRGQPNRILATEPGGYVLRVGPDDVDVVELHGAHGDLLGQEGHGQRQPPVAPADSQRRAHQYAVQARALVPVQLAQLRGQWHDYRGIPTMVTFHPAALLRNPNWKRPTWEDVQTFKKRYDEQRGPA